MYEDLKDTEFKKIITEIRDINPYVKYKYNDYSEEALNAKNKIANYLAPKFFNENLLKALNMEDSLHFTKQMEISNNLLFVQDKNYYAHFSSIIYTEGDKSIFEHFISFLDSIKYKYNKDVANKIIKFVRNERNKNVIYYRCNENYGSLEEEIQNYKDFKNKIETNSFKEFKKDLEFNRCDMDELNPRYINKRVGIIGELQLYKCFLNHSIDPYFISRDCGNGFGFDFLYDFYKNYFINENLIEAKTTIDNNSLRENDWFILSENEYNVMLETFDYNNSDYHVFRIFLNDKLELNNFLILKASNEKTLHDISRDITYELDTTTTKKKFIKKIG